MANGAIDLNELVDAYRPKGPFRPYMSDGVEEELALLFFPTRRVLCQKDQQAK